MQGTGTQDNPYIYTTWAEFVQCAETDNCYCKQGNDIDMNEELPDGITSTVYMDAKEIDGNGYEIRNAYFKDKGWLQTAYGFGTLKNFKLINFYDSRVDAGKGGTIYYNRGDIQNLTISGHVLSSKKQAVFTTGKMKIIGLSANLEGLGGTLSGDGAGYPLDIDNGNIKIDNSNLKWVNLKNCYVSGKIGSVKLIESSRYAESSASIIDAEITTELIGTTGQTAVIYNSDKLSDDATVSGDFFAVTTTQLANATYLKSIGFPIGDE